MKIHITGSFSNTGYGIATKNLTKTLVGKEVDVTIFPIGQVSADTQDDINLFKELRNKQEEFDRNAISLRIFHQFDIFHHTTSRRVGMPIFELDRFTKQERASIYSNDLILVCSKWAKSVVLEQIPRINKVAVVPLGVDSAIFNPNLAPANIFEKANPDTFVVLNCGKWSHNKGHDVLIEMFKRAFRRDDNVELWMMPSNPFLTDTERQNWENIYISPSQNPLYRKIKLLPWVPTQSVVADIMSQANCGIFPSRGEGFNLELLEMMALGKPCIATDYSAHTEFCNKDNSYLIPITDTESAYDGKWFFNQGNWAKIGQKEINDGATLLRTLYEGVANPDVASIIKSAMEAGKRFSWENSATTLIKELECL